jgi:iron complex outermembrane receptor protein
MHYDYSVPGELDVNALVGYNDKETQSHSVAGAYTKVEGNDLLQADLSATFHMMDNQFLLTVGTQGVNETATVTKYNLSSPSDSGSWASVQTKDSGDNLTWGTFIQAEYTPIESTTLYLGGRYDHWWATDTEYSDINGNHAASDDVDDGQFSPKASLVYRLMDNGVLRASYGKSFTAPSLYYRIASYSYSIGGETTYAAGNPDLDPTTNTSWELGTEWEFLDRHLRFKTTYFENDFDDLVVNATRTYVIDGESISIKKRINAESSEVNGIETGIEAILPWDLKGGIHYTHHWSEYTHTEGSSKDGWEVDEVPTDIFNFWLGYFTASLDASVNLRYSDSVYDDKRDPYASCVFNDYSDSFLVDTQVTFRPSQKMALTLSVDNLFDEEYYEYYKGPGRACLATIDVNF